MGYLKMYLQNRSLSHGYSWQLINDVLVHETGKSTWHVNLVCHVICNKWASHGDNEPPHMYYVLSVCTSVYASLIFHPYTFVCNYTSYIHICISIYVLMYALPIIAILQMFIYNNYRINRMTQRVSLTLQLTSLTKSH